MHGIGEQQRAAVEALLEHPTIPSEELAKKLKMSSSSMAGVFSGLSKQMKALNLHPMELYQTSITWEEGERVRRISLDLGFRLAAEEADWPRKEQDAPATNKRKH